MGNNGCIHRWVLIKYLQCIRSKGISNDRTHSADVLTSFVIFFPVIFNLTTIIPYDWPQFGGNPQHSGNNSLETRISTASVASLHRLYQVTLPGVADGSPVVLNAVPTATAR